MENKRSRRFTSINSAKAFKKIVNGELIDLTNNPIRKSNYKVIYTKESANKGFNNQKY